jgi:hypothetical protein
MEPRPRAAFDALGAHAALEATDLTVCRAHGLDRGYLHARVSFAPAGRVARVLVDGAPERPALLSDDGRRCIGARLADVTVAPFDGSPASVAATWFLP